MPSQRASSEEEARSELRALTLTFSDARLEEEYLVEQFRSLFPLHMLLFGLAILGISFCVNSVECEPRPAEGLAVSIVPGMLMRIAMHVLFTPRHGFIYHHRLHIFASTMPFLRKSIQALHTSDPSGDAAVPLSRMGLTGQVIAMAFFPIFIYLHPTRAVPRLWLILNFSVCQVLCQPDAKHCLFMIGIGIVLGHVLELHLRRQYSMRLEIAARSEENRRADSRLNHLLKNKSAEASFLIESVTERLSALGDALQMASILTDLAKVQSIHTQTVEWTHMRELFLQLQRGQYQTTMPPTHVKRLLERVMGTIDTRLELVAPCPSVLCFDAAVLHLMLEESRSNAIKYRDPHVELVVSAELVQEHSEHHPYLHVRVDNQNRTGLPALTPEECEAAFGSGIKGSAAGGGGAAPSTGLGLDSVAAAALAAGGHTWLSTYVHPETRAVHTVFHARLPAQIAKHGDVCLVEDSVKSPLGVELGELKSTIGT